MTHPRTGDPGGSARREASHSGRRRWGRSRCEVETDAESAPPGNFKSKTKKLFSENFFLAGGGGFFLRVSGSRRGWLHRASYGTCLLLTLFRGESYTYTGDLSTEELTLLKTMVRPQQRQRILSIVQVFAHDAKEHDASLKCEHH